MVKKTCQIIVQTCIWARWSRINCRCICKVISPRLRQLRT